MRRVVDPGSAGLHELSGTDGSAMCHHRDRIPLAAYFHPQDAKAVFRIVKTDAIYVSADHWLMHSGLPCEREGPGSGGALDAGQCLLRVPANLVQGKFDGGGDAS